MPSTYKLFELKDDITPEQLSAFLDYLKSQGYYIVGAISDVPMRTHIIIGRKLQD